MMTRDGVYRWIHDRGKIVQWNDDGTPMRIVGTQKDVTEQQEYIKALAETQARLEAFVEHAPTAVAMFDREMRYIAATRKWYTDYGLEQANIIGQSHYDVFPEIGGSWKDIHRRNLDGIIQKRDEDMFVRADGKRQWIRWENRPWYLPDDSIGGIMMYTEDITERKNMENSIKASLAEKETLLKEIHHRVKNNLQVVSSLLSLQAGRVADPEYQKVFAESQTRIQSMAMVHEQLYRTGNLSSINFKEHLTHLIYLLVRSHQNPNQKIYVEKFVEDVEIDVDTAVPLGLIANELISNAFKHGFAGRNSGSVIIELTKSTDMVTLSVADDGEGLPPSVDIETTTSVGLRLVRSLIRQLHGTLKIGDGKKGKFEVTFRYDRHQENVHEQ